ncbi:DUF4390 domain-containing protein [Rhodoferax lacus]|uniref:DUF4390 domain-containing protein n=1 Tax=Rhodoferax lacus TaxID=2184758 RepID=A0A3E1R6K1_9BURK|nr:DUF4390 domain-containing protein [Rhodoferax lacus]RFO94937.1 DUF4390 domain-containing protein [Rhodoferax lacus]
MRLLFACLLLLAAVAHAQVATDITQLRLERSDDEWQLSAQLQFETPMAVEDALLKGIPMVFVYSADVLRERWYWYDKKVQSAERHMRLAYQPLTRRWRLNVGSGSAASSGVGLALNQSFDSLAQALSAIKRVAKWRIADVSDLDASTKYKVDFRFRLDLGQLPRPFQIGALGQSDWDVSASVVTPLVAESSK